jgi:hypothetical protein
MQALANAAVEVLTQHTTVRKSAERWRVNPRTLRDRVQQDCDLARLSPVAPPSSGGPPDPAAAMVQRVRGEILNDGLALLERCRAMQAGTAKDLHSLVTVWERVVRVLLGLAVPAPEPPGGGECQGQVLPRPVPDAGPYIDLSAPPPAEAD